MNRTKIATVSFLSILPKRSLWMCILVALMLISSADSAAQSTDRDYPTQLTSNEISGLIDSESIGKVYYYKFTVNPGEVTITLSVQSNSSGINSVSFTLFDRNAAAIAGKPVLSFYGGETQQAVARINISRRQEVVLSVNISDRFSNTANGRYRLRLSGPIETKQNAQAAEGGPVTPDAFDRVLENSKLEQQRMLERGDRCFPAKGTLVVKMKDGSKKIIDLSEAETVTVVP